MAPDKSRERVLSHHDEPGYRFRVARQLRERRDEAYASHMRFISVSIREVDAVLSLLDDQHAIINDFTLGWAGRPGDQGICNRIA